MATTARIYHNDRHVKSFWFQYYFRYYTIIYRLMILSTKN